MSATTDQTAIASEVLQRYAALPTANIGDAMDRLGIMDAGIKPVWPGARLVAPAFTILTRSGDNLLVHEALDAARPGEVVVVNGFGDTTRALIGELIARRAMARGLAGFVIDGAVRDVDDLARLGLPVFARAVTPAGPYKNGPGRLQVPVAVGRLCVCPGDLVIGDSDGVAVVPRQDLWHVLGAAEEIFENEARKRSAITGEPALDASS